MKIFPLLLILFLLTIESQNMSARAEGDSLRIARPGFPRQAGKLCQPTLHLPIAMLRPSCCLYDGSLSRQLRRKGGCLSDSFKSCFELGPSRQFANK